LTANSVAHVLFSRQKQHSESVKIFKSKHYVVTGNIPRNSKYHVCDQLVILVQIVTYF